MSATASGPSEGSLDLTLTRAAVHATGTCCCESTKLTRPDQCTSGRSHLTREARCRTFNTFARIMRELGYGIQAASQIGGEHLLAFTPPNFSRGWSANPRQGAEPPARRAQAR
jgi:hypothetical protein